MDGRWELSAVVFMRALLERPIAECDPLPDRGLER